MSVEHRCRKCGRPCDELWKMCGQCYAADTAYRNQCDKLMTQRFGGSDSEAISRNKDMNGSYISKEHKHRKLRTKENHSFDESPECRNCRTEYHGDNYQDE